MLTGKERADRFDAVHTHGTRPGSRPGPGGAIVGGADHILPRRLRISPWPQDFTMMGVPFPHRGRRLDECIDIVRGLCGGGPFQYHGEFYDIPEIEINPVPTQPLPILLGGHGDAALRRSVVRGDGWMSAGATPADLDTMLAHCPPSAEN